MRKIPKPNTTKVQADLRRTAYKFKHDYFSFERVILAIAVVLCVSWTWRAISSMSRNWELEQRLAAREKELAILELEVDNLAAENAYYQTEEYQELAARLRQNKKLPGETMIYLPDNTEEAKAKHKTSEGTINSEPPSNFEQWINFLFGA